MADNKNKENIEKKTQENIDESSLKQAIDSVSLDWIESLLPEKETDSTKKSKDETTSSLSWIDDISSYIQKQKAKSDRISPELLTARDGTDLLSQEGVYAVVPHKKNDHKIVYTRENAPNNLLDDPKKRKKWTEYKKNSMKIYDVHVDYAEHPTLMSADGQPLDVWIIDEPQDLEDQLQAIRDGKWGGTNFMSPILASKSQDEELNTTSKEELEEKSTTPKKITKKKKEILKEEIKIQEEETKKVKSLDDILPIQSKGIIEGNKKEEKEKTEEEMEEEKERKKTELSLDDILPVWWIVKSENENVKEIPVEEKKPKKEFSLDDILPKKEEDIQKEISWVTIKKKTKKSKWEAKKTLSPKSSQSEILKESGKKNKISLNKEKSVINKKKKNDDLNISKWLEVFETTEEVLLEPKKNDQVGSIDDSAKVIEEVTQKVKSNEVSLLVPNLDKEKASKKEPITEEVKAMDKEKKQTPEIEIEIPSLDAFIPKVTLEDASKSDSKPEKDIEKKITLQNTIVTPKQEDVTTLEVPNNNDEKNDRTKWFSAEDLLPPQINTSQTTKEKIVQPVELLSTFETIELTTEKDSFVSETPAESSQSKPSELVQEKIKEETPDLIDLDTMTFEPIAQSNLPQDKTTTVHNDWVIGNENEEKSAKWNIWLLILKIVVAIVLIWIAVWIGFIMIWWSKTSPTTLEETPPTQEQELPEDTNTDEPEVPWPWNKEIPEPKDPEPIQPQPLPTEDPIVEVPDEQTFTLPQLIAKLEVQQSEARRLLNKAKLLNNREWIKFATAGFIKSSKSLDEAAQDPTITADKLQRDAQRIDLYLWQAQSIVEK